MADIRCSNCGKDNPDFLDLCQFCQSPLRPDPLLSIGEEPTKKDTGELEEILPEWLKDARQQGKNEEAADDAFRSQTKPKVLKDEPPDLLAGLMSQADSDEDDVPDWLAGINPVAEKESSKPSSKKEEEPSDFFAKFRQPEAEPSVTPESEPAQEEVPAWMGMDETPPGQTDELTDWLSQASTESGAPPAFDNVNEAPSDDNSWLKNLGSFDVPVEEPSAQKAPEDLSWLHDLEAASKGTSEVPAPQMEAGFDFAPASSDEDLSWLNNLGGPSAPSFEESAPAQTSSSGEDLDWLSNLGGTPAPAFDEPAPAQSASSDEDLGWLNNLGGTPAPAFDEPASAQSASSSGEDLDWLDNLGEASNASAPAFESGGQPQDSALPGGVPSKPFRTAPLNELLNDEAIKETTPDWLQNAMEEPSMPAPGAVSMDWFSDRAKPAEYDGEGVPTQAEPASSQSAFDFSSGDAATPASQDLDSLFNLEMPDWLANEPGGVETSQSESDSTPAFAGDSLAPVELPSWVQAMRPVDSAISGISAGEDQITETQGPLAGFRGVIPSTPIGSSLRPKAFSLKLQVTGEQQAGASLLEQIIAAETMAQTRKPAGLVSSQRVIRWVLSGLFLVVLGVALGFGLRTMPIYASATVNELSNLVAAIPESSPVLVVVDYEPSFAGELEAGAGPLLDQLALSRRSTFNFVSMSPNGSALVDRLMFNTGISQPAPNGLNYQPGIQYFNLGFLPGGSSGVLGFIETPEVDFARFAAIILMTDNAETGRIWVEQLEAAKPEIFGKPLLLVSSAQAGPMLQPYVASGQADVLINGLYDAAKYEYVNNSRPGTARLYWDAFGAGLMMAIVAIVLGSAWSILMRVREKRAEGEQG